MAILFRLPFDPFTKDAAILANGTVTFYQTGTLVLDTVYTNNGLSVAATNPAPLNSAGQFTQGSIFLAERDYRVVVKDSLGAVVPNGDVDPVHGVILPATVLNSFDDKFAAAGMPANMTLSGITGATRYRVTVAFHGNLNNTNATLIGARITVAVKDGVSTLQSREWQSGAAANIPIAYNDKIAFVLSFNVAAPAAGAYTIAITDTESDGGAHAWTVIGVSASANI